MNRAFIVRPFNTQAGVDFEKVDKQLIQPALQQAGITGSTTTYIVEQGNIREDMFAQLLLADLVIADISIHNANVFYELGIRHALRDKCTFLLRCSVAGHDVPFDLKTDRYLSYDADNPAKNVDALATALKATILTERVDSPVFNMLPKLKAQDPERFLAVPNDFGEEVKLAEAGRQIGKLALLAYEATGFAWEMPAIRMCAEALFKLKDFEAAGINWEKVRNKYCNDLEANDRLATIYQRLAEDEMKLNPTLGWELLGKSDLAIERMLTNMGSLDANKRAETFSLKGRNAKTRWVDTWINTPDSETRKKALQSTWLIDAYEFYERAFSEDLNHFYSGINALGLLTVIVSLAGQFPELFSLEYDTEEAAETELKKFKDRLPKLAQLVQASIDAQRLRNGAEQDMWLNMTEADLACLTSTRPLRVKGLYHKVIQEASNFKFDAAKRQLLIYKCLGVQVENVTEALDAFQSSAILDDEIKRHYLLFTGHMIDKKDRPEPRFPEEMESRARVAIKEKVQAQLDKYGTRLKGIAGGACGGDILFHEVCEELGIATEMLLVLPREQFIVASVEFAGVGWVDRFNTLYTKVPRQVLAVTKELPKWLQAKPGYSIWERNNLWMLNSALVCGGINMSLIALWDGKGGDGAGGTEHMVKEAKARGARTEIIDVSSLK